MNEQGSGGERRRLDQAPGARYRPRDPAGAASGPADRSGSGGRGPSPRTRAVVTAIVVADLGALGYFALGLLDLGAAMLAVAAFVGWVTGVALIWWGRGAVAPHRLRLGLAAGLGAWAILFAMAIDWVYAMIQGGALGPIDYVIQRYGWWGLASIPLAALLAAFRAR